MKKMVSMKIIEKFEKMIKHGSEDTMFTIPRWIHQMSIDIHTSNEPVKINRRTKNIYF